MQGTGREAFRKEGVTGVGSRQCSQHHDWQHISAVLPSPDCSFCRLYFSGQYALLECSSTEGNAGLTGLQCVRLVVRRRRDEVELRQFHILGYCHLARHVPPVHHVSRRIANCNSNKQPKL